MAQSPDYPRPLARGGPRILAALGVVLVAGTLLALALAGWARYAAGQPNITAYAYRYDFVSLYTGARLVATGQGAALYDLPTQARMMDAATAPYQHPLLLPYLNPGYVAVALAPLGALPFAAAFLLWSALNLALVVWVTARWVRVVVPPGPGRIAGALLLAGAMPVLLTLLLGQIALWPLLGVTEAWFALQAGRSRRAGAWLLLGLVKPHLLLVPLLVLLWTGRGRVVAWFGLGAAAVTGVSLVLLGNWLPGFVAVTAGGLGGGAVTGDYPVAMANWRGLVAGLTGQDAPALVAGLTGGSLAALAIRARRLPFPVAMAAALLTGLLVSPHLYLHDTVLALPAGCVLWRAAPRWGGLLLAGWGVAWIAQFTAGGVGAAYLAFLVGAILLIPPRYPQ